jgi:hypothetical protein
MSAVYVRIVVRRTGFSSLILTFRVALARAAAVRTRVAGAASPSGEI